MSGNAIKRGKAYRAHGAHKPHNSSKFCQPRNPRDSAGRKRTRRHTRRQTSFSSRHGTSKSSRKAPVARVSCQAPVALVAPKASKSAVLKKRETRRLRTQNIQTTDRETALSELYVLMESLEEWLDKIILHCPSSSQETNREYAVLAEVIRFIEW